jgi:hypothetical protein
VARYSANDAKGGHDVSNYLAASVIVILATLPSLGQVKESGGRVVADKMEIPRYDPLAAMAGVSAEVTLRLQVKRSGDVISVNVVGAHADCGFASGCDTGAGKGWSARFVDWAAQAAKISKFSCSKCEGPIFDHMVTYRFDYPPRPKGVCTDAVPPPPPSTVDSPSHVTVRPQGWSCVQP